MSDEQIYGNCGLEDEKCLDDCNFPPRIGKQGVKGCKAAPSVTIFFLMKFPSPRLSAKKKDRKKNEKSHIIKCSFLIFIKKKKQDTMQFFFLMELTAHLIIFLHNKHSS